MEIQRLPGALLRAVFSLTSPRDACCVAAVSRAFRAAADSDAVWSCFLPRDLPRLARKQLTRKPPSSKKGLFRRLVLQPALLPGKIVSMRLDRVTGAKCYMMSARALDIHYWGYMRICNDNYWINMSGGKRFFQAAQLRYSSWLDVSGKIQSKMLSGNTTYAAYMVFKLEDSHHRLGFPQVASISVGGSQKSTRQTCLQAPTNEEEARAPPCQLLPSGEDVALPRTRADGWMELELGQFYNEEGDDREVSISLTETTRTWKTGPIVWGIEFRSSTIV